MVHSCVHRMTQEGMIVGLHQLPCKAQATLTILTVNNNTVPSVSQQLLFTVNITRNRMQNPIIKTHYFVTGVRRKTNA
jgi:hypothetical protein